MHWHAVGCAPDRRGGTPPHRGTDRRVHANRRVSGWRATRPVSPPPARSIPADPDRRRAAAAAGTDQRGRTSRRSSRRRARGPESWRTKPRHESADSSGHARYRRGVCPYSYRAKSFALKAGLITTEVNVISSSTCSRADLTMRCATLMPETCRRSLNVQMISVCWGSVGVALPGAGKLDLALVPNPSGHARGGVELERRRPIARTRGNNRGRVRWLEHQRHRLAGKREHAEHEARESRPFDPDLLGTVCRAMGGVGRKGLRGVQKRLAIETRPQLDGIPFDDAQVFIGQGSSNFQRSLRAQLSRRPDQVARERSGRPIEAKPQPVRPRPRRELERGIDGVL